MDLGRHVVVLLALLLAGCQGLPVDADEKPGIGRVFERYRTAIQVERVSETFVAAQPEEGADATYLSDPKSRVGYEFAVSLDGSLEIPQGSRFRLECVFKEGESTFTHFFPIERRPGWFFGEYILRLTGKDDPGSKVRPIAWRISVVGPDGTILAARRSFLWGAPNDASVR